MLTGDIAVSLSIEVPDDIRDALESHWGDLSHRLREELAAEGYRQGLLTLAQVRRLLRFASRWQAQEFLAQRGVADFDFDPAELDREAALQESAARTSRDAG
jgi:predicted HTH domain antitoxin